MQAPIEYDDALLELLWHPTVFPLVRAALGDDVSMIDNDLFLTPPNTPRTHADWHHDVGMPGVYHPSSLLMVKVFYLLTDVTDDMGPTQMVPGSHRWEATPGELEPIVTMTGKAGDAYLFNGRIYHRAANNASDRWRKVLIYNYGHFWMKVWQGYEPSARLLERRARLWRSGAPAASRPRRRLRTEASVKRWGVWLLVVLALVLPRALFLNADAAPDLCWGTGIWTDEGFYTHNARNAVLFGQAELDGFNNRNLSPVLDLLQQGVFRTFGVGLIPVRALSVVFGLLALVFFYDGLRRTLGRRIAVTATLFSVSSRRISSTTASR